MAVPIPAPADVYFGRGQNILLEREKTQKQNHPTATLASQNSHSLKSNRMRQNLPWIRTQLSQ
jgi:hypothetical protein